VEGRCGRGVRREESKVFAFGGVCEGLVVRCGERGLRTIVETGDLRGHGSWCWGLCDVTLFSGSLKS
jgi:hypothetical protein